MIQLVNKHRRYFSCDLERSPINEKQTFRTTHDSKTGNEGLAFHSYKEYLQISLQFNERSQPLEDDVLKNASVAGAVRSKWLQVIRL